jgi:predicted nucleotidyltransferase
MAQYNVEQLNQGRNFMTPNPLRPKYTGRDQLLGQVEAERRRDVVPAVQGELTRFCITYKLPVPNVQIKGSVAINMCDETSDLDLAVVVEEGHPLAENPNTRWLMRQSFDRGLKRDQRITFPVQTRVVVRLDDGRYAIPLGDI